MSSIRIHQDLYNFERKRKSFTSRQWRSIVSAVAASVAMGAVCIYALALPPEASLIPILIVAAPFIVFGFVPIQRMPAEKFLERSAEMKERGDALVWKGEKTPRMESELSREYVKASRKKDFECTSSRQVEQAALDIEALNTEEWPRRCYIMP